MADNKKGAKTVKNESVESVENIEKSENLSETKNVVTANGKMSLNDVSVIVNTIVDSLFVERNGRLEYAAEIYEVLLAYMEIGAFFPNTKVFEDGLGVFFINYIDGKYYNQIGKLKYNTLAQYIENAVKRKIEARMKQIENPLFNSLERLIDAAGVVMQNYADNINNVGTDDIKRFIEDFAGFTKKTNPKTVADEIVKTRMNEMKENDKLNNTGAQKAAVKKQGGRAKKTAV